ncbi:MAG: hypothetical protein QW292_08910 [Candidatus Parvarchaeota archaeon]
MMFQKCMTPLKCTLFSKFNREEKIDTFFSTTWCRDRLFTSENPNDILKFYDTFSNRDELIKWMKERPKGRAEIIEVEGDKEIIVVIPTADFNGKYAKECRENIFKGLHIIFVESGFPKDPYFNYAHNCNVGIKKAMEYNPKWIAVSNDDMKKVDDIGLLVEKLNDVNPLKADTVYTSHSNVYFVGWERAPFYRLASYFRYLLKGDRVTRELINKIRDRYNITIRGYRKLPLVTLLFKNYYQYRLSWDFAIFSFSYARSKKGDIYDETFVNGVEDYDVFLEIYRSGKYSDVDYTISSIGGGSLGGGSKRALRELLGFLYLDEKMKGCTRGSPRKSND